MEPEHEASAIAGPAGVRDGTVDHAISITEHVDLWSVEFGPPAAIDRGTALNSLKEHVLGAQRLARDTVSVDHGQYCAGVCRDERASTKVRHNRSHALPSPAAALDHSKQ
jgi:hypothetical protein